ncbi:DUF3135 domain-containing protein [Aquisalimonas sp. 2447]|uniref:DUF3135 domain-containing protein n=1 Tax=Aquisalimonas sp. 2447 TaxID=2740807 RepID=UPI0014327EF5|nr:DUF3135 domain-containing protein [Aquisalimonas sp. 2447]QIT53927.1 DUF3135 domain-containing protein [Aquisalimonas sp. 2447]
MHTRRPSSANFDQWRELARSDPAMFEKRRQEAIAEVIRTAPPGRRERLRRLQWRIDRERDRYPDPMAACARLSRMMWESVHGPGGLVEHLRELEACWLGHPRQHMPKARVLGFPGRRDQNNAGL